MELRVNRVIVFQKCTFRLAMVIVRIGTTVKNQITVKVEHTKVSGLIFSVHILKYFTPKKLDTFIKQNV